MLTELARFTLAFLLLTALGLLVFPAPIPSAVRRCGVALAILQAFVTMNIAHDDSAVAAGGAHHQVAAGLANHVVPSLAAGLLAWVLILVGRAWRAAARALREAPPPRR